MVSFENEVIKEEYFHPGWVPIGYDYGGNYIGIDFSPARNGKSGQIINFGRDEHELFVGECDKDDFYVFKELKGIEYITCPYKVFIKTKDMFDTKIFYAISGGMSKEEKVYEQYVMGDREKDNNACEAESEVSGNTVVNGTSKKPWWKFW